MGYVILPVILFQKYLIFSYRLNEKLKHFSSKNIADILNPSNDASITSPGRKLKNFFPAFEFTTEPVKIPDTFTTPERKPVATFSVILVTLLTL